MATGLVLDETIRSIVRDEIKKAGLTNFNEEMDARADQRLDEFFNENKIEEKVTAYLENNIDVGDSVNEVITNGSFDISFSG